MYYKIGEKMIPVKTICTFYVGNQHGLTNSETIYINLLDGSRMDYDDIHEADVKK